MPTRPGPTVQRRRLGIELRRLREAAGKTIDEVAQVLECSDSKVSRVENGQVSASPRDVRDMLELYGVDPERRDQLVEFAREARRKGWWQAYSDTTAVPMAGLEVAADQIHAYEPMVVHGLLQTEQYARAMIHAVRPDLPSEQIERRVEFRMLRQERLRRDHAGTFVLVIEECALRRPVGGREVHRRQLLHLTEAVNLPALTFQILPLSVGEHAALAGAFTIYRYSQPDDHDIVYLEETASDLYLEHPRQVDRYSSAFEAIRAVSLPPDDSLSMLISLTQAI
jgi:transcriptional regulator with XRE-family HTH domain